MLKLYSIRKDDVVYTFLGGRKYIVGRKNGDVILPDDQSISRHHADIEVDHPRANIDNPALQPTLMITDVGSKFGTFINEQIDGSPGIPINMREPANLEDGSRVRFGRQWSEFRFEYTPLVITCSTLRDTSQLKELIGQLGGHLVPEWTSECRYVVMDSVTLTIKAVCALLAGGYIVSPNYFKDLVASVLASQSTTKLDPMNYTPPLAEAGLSSSNVNLKPLPARSRLFRGKTFLFYNNKQMKKLGILVKTGGGNIKLILDCPASELGSADILMMSPPVEISLLDKTNVKAIDMYKASGKRLIQESEISLAAVYVNIGKQCNPYYDYAQRIFPPMPSQTQRSPDRGSVIIPETQSSAETQRTEGPYSRDVIAESCNMTDNSDPSGPSVLSGTKIKSEKNPGTGVKRGGDSEDTSTSKRRLELESETPGTSAFQSEPQTKRQKSSVLSSQAKSKTLSALFKMSDSEDDDDDDNFILPSTSGQQADPMSQSQRRVTRGTSGVPAADFDFVGIPKKNLRSPNKVGSSSSRSNREAAAKANSESRGTPFVDFVPGSSDESDDDKEGPNNNNASILPTAALPTMALPTMALPTMALPTMPLPTMPLPTAQLPTLALSQRGRRGRKTTTQETTEEMESSSSARPKRRADNDVVVNDDKPKSKKSKVRDIFGTKTSSTAGIDKKFDKMTIDAVEPKKKLTEITELLKEAPVQFASLIREDRPPFPPPTASSGSSSSGPNFKRFKKVWPLTPYNSTDVKEAEETIKNSAPVPCASVKIEIPIPTEKPSKPVKKKKQKKVPEEEKVEEEKKEDCFVVPSTSTRATRSSRSRNPTPPPAVVVKSPRKKPAPRIASPKKKSTVKLRTSPRKVAPKVDSPPMMDIDDNDDEDESEGLFDF